jgi:hypothetical protein
MENLINPDTIRCFIAFLAFTLGMRVSVMASKRVRHAPRLHRTRGPHRPGAEAIVSGSPGECFRRTQRAPAHGKE